MRGILAQTPQEMNPCLPHILGMNDILPRSRGDRYALSALKNKRAELASEIVGIERQLRHRREALGHVDEMPFGGDDGERSGQSGHELG